MFTFGGLGVGWLIDLCRIPFLVKEANRELENQQRVDALESPVASSGSAGAPGVVKVPVADLEYPSDGSNPGTLHITHPHVYSTGKSCFLVALIPQS